VNEKLIKAMKNKDTSKTRDMNIFVILLICGKYKDTSDIIEIKPKNTARSFHLPIRLEVGDVSTLKVRKSAPNANLAKWYIAKIANEAIIQEYRCNILFVV